MKKLLALPFKLVAAPLFIAAPLILAIGGLIINGREKTGKTIMELAKAMENIKP